MKKLFSIMIILIIAIFIVGCGNDNKKNSQLNDKEKMQETVDTIKSLEENYNEIQKQNNIKNKSEIFVGKDLTGNECYLVVDSVKIGYSGVINCSTKLYKNGKVNYESYTFENKDGLITFSNSKESRIVVDENNTPLEYNILYEIDKIYGNEQENKNNQQNSKTTKKEIDYVNDKEIFVGHSDVTDRDCYLLTDSIDINLDEFVRGREGYYICKIKMVKSNNDVKYLKYKFFSKTKFHPPKFENDQGFSGIIDEYETPIEYNTFMALKRHLEEFIENEKEKSRNRK